jgi:tRNA(fMet)-specific endonuclease VapC
MSGKLLDTNAVLALQKSDPALLRFLNSDDELFIPAIVIGELYYGAANSERVAENRTVIEALITESAVLVCDSVTARIYGDIRHALKIKGRPIPENDIWIGAIALQYGLTLITQDTHFQEIDGLAVEDWST